MDERDDLRRELQAEASKRPCPGAVAREKPATPVDVLADRLQALCVAQGSGCLSSGLISGRPCVVTAAPCRLEVAGVEVLFPFEPLAPQRAVIKSVLEALSQCRHGVLESPTGTGKTAAVLCAALAWQRHRMAKTGSAPQIMYATRTHAQVRQAIKELRRTPYRPVMAVLGSREAGLCVNSQVLHGADHDGQVRQGCRRARQQKSCEFHEGLSSLQLPDLAMAKLRANEPWDIEEAASFANATTCCPYYVAHSLARHAELVFCPYSYVLDPSVRQAAGLSCADLTGRIVILDEAHNVEGVCRDAGSAELTLDHLKASLFAVKRLLGEEGPSQSITVPVQKSGPVDDLGGFFVPAAEVSEPVRNLKRPNGLQRSLKPLAALLQRLVNFVSDVVEPRSYAPHLPEHRRVEALLRILKLEDEVLLRGQPCKAESLLRDLAGWGAQLELAASLCGQLAAAVRSPELYVARVHPAAKGQQAYLHLWLMSAEGTLGKLANELHALVLMSGTLSPLPTTIAELGPSFQSRALAPVAANHVVGPEALRVVTVNQQSAAATSKLECTFHAWKRRPFLLSIGHALLAVARAMPAGLLVFLPSYDLLERCMEAWQQVEGQTFELPRKGRGRGRAKRRGAVERVFEEIPENTGGKSILDELREAHRSKE